MKKKTIKITIILIIFLLFFSSVNVYASNFATYGKGSVVLKRNYGGTKKANGGKKCGVSTLCFTGRGMYVYLVRYDPKTKKEKIVGKPILYYSGGLLDDQVMVEEDAESAKVANGDNGIVKAILELEQNNGTVGGLAKFLATVFIGLGFSPSNSCNVNLGTYTYKSEIIDEAQKQYITYSVGKSDFIGGIKSFSDIKKQHVKVDLTPDGEADLIALAKFIVSKVRSLVGDGAPTLNASFDTNEVDASKLDEYYIGIEYASRKLSDIKSTTTITDNPPVLENFGTIGKLQHEWTCNTNNNKKYQTTKPTSTCPDKYEWNNDDCTCKWASCSGDDTSKNGNSCSKGSSGSGTCKCSCSCNHEKGDSCNPSKTSSSHCVVATKGKWSLTKCDGGTVDYYKQLITIIKVMGSKIQNARASGNSSLIQGISTGLIESSCGDGSSTFSSSSGRRYGIANCTCEYYVDRNGKTFRECFIGPDLKRSLVGRSSSETDRNTFRYHFGNSGTDTSNHANGVSYWWVPGNMNGCLKSENGPCNKNDLKCAENYCENLIGYDDRADSYGAKRECIVDLCKVKEPEDPCKSKNSEDKDNYTNNSMYRDYKETSCDKQIVSDCEPEALTTTAPPGEETTYTYTGTLSSKTPSKVWCYSYKSAIKKEYRNIDEMTFINVTCVESSSVKYTNPSQQKIIAGSGIAYNASLKGQKKCHIWFDLKSWQLEYASFSDKEEVCLRSDVNSNGTCKNGKNSRKVLEKILKDYNDMAKGNYTKGLAETIGSILDPSELENASITFEDLNYTIDEARSSVVLEVTESVDDKVVKSGKYELKEVASESRSLNTTIAVSTKTTTGSKYRRLKETKVKANTYDSLSSLETKYELDKYCISTDLKGTVEKRDICYTIGLKNGKAKQVQGQRVYYTSLLSLGNVDNYKIKFEAVAKIETVNPSLSTSAMNAAKICEPTEYKQKCEWNSACSVTFVKKDGTKLTDGVYDGKEGIKAILSIETKNLGDNEIVAYSLVQGKTADTITLADIGSKKISEIEIKPNNKGLKQINVAGMVKLKSGDTLVCGNSTKLVNCTSACKINLVNKGKTYLKYSITDVSSTPKVYTSNDSARLNVVKYNDGYYFTIKKNDSKEAFKIIVEDDEKRCCDTIVTGKNPPPPENDGYDCINTFNKDKKKTKAEIKEYCKNWNQDVSNFSGFDDCVNSCWVNCPIVEKCESSEINKVIEYCESIHKNDTERKNQCINACYNKTCGSNDYIYRPISNLDPFPQSYISPLYKGTRKIGANWVGFENYIISDDKDESSVTGANKNRNVEYVVDLDPSQIREIRSNSIALKKNEHIDPYVDYKYSKYVDTRVSKYGGNFATEYKSEFIHDTYNSIFKDGLTSNGQYLRAEKYGK